MNIAELEKELNNYRVGSTKGSWHRLPLIYKNIYISGVSIDNSNKRINATDLIKQWSIIVKIHKDFTQLTKFKQIEKLDIAVTPVVRGKNTGCYGIRIYNMKEYPNQEIVKIILDFIFE